MIKHITQDQFKKMPWKNGGGTTTELFRLGEEDFVLRISMARIENDGPFSLFAGYNRHLIILDGNGCILKNDSKQVALNPTSAPYYFSGDDQIDCRLINGPVKDFNVIIDRSWGEAQVEFRLDLKDVQVKCDDDMMIFYDLKDQELWIMENGDELRSKTRKAITIRIKKIISQNNKHKAH